MSTQLDRKGPEVDAAGASPDAGGTTTAGDAGRQVGAAAGEPAVAELQRERDDLHDRLLRKAAEFDNYRKRVERERREQAETAAVDLLKTLLPIVDDLERALQADAGPGAAGAYRHGVELIHQQLVELLRKHGVTPIETAGVEFDPRCHEAVTLEASDRHRHGEVIAELRRGYKLGDRLLRPAMVKVAKA